jgi:hypothetical protein
MLRRRNPKQSIVAGNFETPLIFNDILESRGLPLINLNSTITTQPTSGGQAGWTSSMPSYSVFSLPVDGLYEFVLNACFTSAATYCNLHLWKNDKVIATTAYAKASYFAGGVLTCKTYMRTTDTAFFSVLIGGASATTANILLNYDIAHWCSVRMIEY